MALFIPALVIAAAGLLSIACDDSSDKNSSQSDSKKGTKRPESTQMPCDGNRYSLPFGSKNLEICHKDSNRDGIVQKEVESVKIRDAESTISLSDEAGFKAFKKKYGLPDFQGLHLGLWRDLRQSYFPSSKGSWKLFNEEQFSKIVETLQKERIDLKEIKSAAKDLHLPGSPDTHNFGTILYGLFLVSLLEKLRKSKNHSFYKNNQEFIDTILDKIQKGGLKVQGPRPEVKFAPGKTTQAFYDFKEDTLLFNYHLPNLDPSRDYVVLIHELVHFFQDIEKRSLKFWQSEAQAYLVAAEFVIREEGLDEKPYDPRLIQDFIEKYIDTHLNWETFKKNNAFRPALATSYAKIHGKKSEVDRYLKELEDQSRLYTAIQDLKSMENFYNAAPDFLAIKQNFLQAGQLGGERKERFLSELKSVSRQIREDKENAMNAMREGKNPEVYGGMFLGAWFQILHYDFFIEALSSASKSEFDPNNQTGILSRNVMDSPHLMEEFNSNILSIGMFGDQSTEFDGIK